MELQELLSTLQTQHDELEKLAQKTEQGNAALEAFEQRAAKVQDPVERLRFEVAAAELRNSNLASQQINLIMRRVVQLEQAVLVLGDQVGQLVRERDG
jgi:predicted  nucleic acid-binding Zn-ribbon protein